MKPFEPSRDWTTFDRLTLIARIASLQAELLRAGALTPERAFDIAERIRFIATMGAGFLEANRDAILNGSAVTYQ
jgi:hypothetical protein